MPGAKIPVLEIENLFFEEDGRGLILRNDATNCVVQSGTPWTGWNLSGGTHAHNSRYWLSAENCYGWLKVHYISGNEYGPTGASAYIPLFRNLDTRTA